MHSGKILKYSKAIWEKYTNHPFLVLPSSSSEGEKEVEELHFSNTKSIILPYSAVLKRLEKSYKIKTVVKISKMVMKENFCLRYFFHPSFQGLPVDNGKRKM